MKEAKDSTEVSLEDSRSRGEMMRIRDVGQVAKC